MRTKWRYACLGCSSVYEYYHLVRGWTCPNCGSDKALIQSFLTEDF